ncbi:MAG: 2-phospho-L-lactate guanylyltransferase [Chloroflexota bacterium]
MGVWVLVPVKPLLRAKSRLADVLGQEARAKLAEAMLRRTLHVVLALPQTEGVLVISRGSHALAISREMGANTVQESGAPELNTALMRATQVLHGFKAEAVLILPADIPLITTDELSEVLAMGTEDQTVVIATDREADGTNVLLVRPPGVFEYAYGEGSFQRHQQLARLAKMEVRIYESERLSLDIDTAEDLATYEQYVADGTFGATPLVLPGDG